MFFKGNQKKIYLLCDTKNWALDFQAKELKKMLARDFKCKIGYVRESPDLSRENFDLLFVLFWGETYHKKFNIPHYKIIKQLSSHRWENEELYGFLTPRQTNQIHLKDADFVTGMSLKLVERFKGERDVIHLPQSVNTNLFKIKKKREGPMVIGWVGNENDPCKGLFDILIPSTTNRFIFRKAGGKLTQKELVDFYNSIDIICNASTAEGGPLPVAEAMACGCFPVCVEVGIIPQIISNRENGIIVERSIEAFQKAFEWCEKNLETVRKIGLDNRRLIVQQRSSNALREYTRKVFNDIYHQSVQPRFRNDDVSYDTNLEELRNLTKYLLIMDLNSYMV